MRYWDPHDGYSMKWVGQFKGVWLAGRYVNVGVWVVTRCSWDSDSEQVMVCRESAVLPRCLSFCHPPPKFCITKYHFSSFIYTLTSLLSLLMGHFNFHISPYIPHHPHHLWVPFHLGLCQGCPTHFYFTPSHYSSSSPPYDNNKVLS